MTKPAAVPLPRRTALVLGGAGLAMPFLIRPARAATSWIFYTTQHRGSVGAGVWAAMTQAIKTATDGALDITLVTAGRIGVDANAVSAAVASGAIAMGDDSYFGQAVVGGGIARLPLLVPDRDALQRGAKPLKAFLAAAYLGRGTTLLGYTFTPRLRTWGRVRFDNFAGLLNRRIRTVSAEQAEFVRRLGAIPVTMPTAAVERALQNGDIDIVFGSAARAGTLWRKYLVAGYEVGPHPLDAALIVNKSAVDALAKPVRDILLREVAKAEADLIDAVFAAEEAARTRLAGDGLTLAERQSDDVLTVTQKMALMWADWTRVRGPEVQDLLLAFRRALEEGETK